MFYPKIMLLTNSPSQAGEWKQHYFREHCYFTRNETHDQCIYVFFKGQNGSFTQYMGYV